MRILLGFVLMLCAAPTMARQGASMAPIGHDTAVTLRPDRAYVLFRMRPAATVVRFLEPVFLRKPSEDELNAYRAAKKAAFDRDLPKLLKQVGKGQPAPGLDTYAFTYDGPGNVDKIDRTKFVEDGEDRVFLVEAIPGDYVLYGIAQGTDLVWVCNCLGTVSFRADAGIITDIGTILMAQAHLPTDIPELKTETDLGKSVSPVGILFAEAVRSSRPDSYVPQSLRGFNRKPAHFEPVAPFVETGTAYINRLAPMPGILSYDGGKVIDGRTGKVVP